MDFTILSDLEGSRDDTLQPFVGKDESGDWVAGGISKTWLNEHFGQYETATEMKNATTSEGLKLFFDWLVGQGILPN